MSTTKKILLAIAIVIVIVELIFANAILSNFLITLCVIVVNLNAIYVMWRVLISQDESEDYYE